MDEYCKSRLEDIKQLQRGNKIYAFLMHLIEYCREQTFSPTYSYRTVSGFAVKEENTGQYGQDGFWFQDKTNEELATLLKDCMANNLLYKVPATSVMAVTIGSISGERTHASLHWSRPLKKIWHKKPSVACPRKYLLSI